MYSQFHPVAQCQAAQSAGAELLRAMSSQRLRSSSACWASCATSFRRSMQCATSGASHTSQVSRTRAGNKGTQLGELGRTLCTPADRTSGEVVCIKPGGLVAIKNQELRGATGPRQFPTMQLCVNDISQAVNDDTGIEAIQRELEMATDIRMIMVRDEETSSQNRARHWRTRLRSSRRLPVQTL